MEDWHQKGLAAQQRLKIKGVRGGDWNRYTGVVSGATDYSSFIFLERIPWAEQISRLPKVLLCPLRNTTL